MTNELTADGLRELLAGATRQGWTADAFGNLCIGMKPLFKKTGGSTQDAALIVALVNAAPQIIALMEREARMREALEKAIWKFGGGHRFGCTTSIRPADSTCTCGFFDALRAALQPKETDDACGE